MEIKRIYNEFTNGLKNSKTFERFFDNKDKEGFPSRLLIISITILPFILLFLAVLEMDKEYYQFLRWPMCAISLFYLLWAYDENDQKYITIFAIFAVMYNPIMKIFLIIKSKWVIVNLATALCFFLFLKKRAKKK